jgi:3-deoxy-manno-octulosonate cytidylyltransferase (CMP-KDO synthetase)
VSVGYCVFIPARLGSTRLPEKALLRETGKYLVQHVHERAIYAPGRPRTVVLTDDDRIKAAVRSYGGEVFRSRKPHTSGTSRCAEATKELLGGRLSKIIVVNLQGDEPFVDSGDLYRLAEAAADASIDMATMAYPFSSPEDVLNPNKVKVYVGPDDIAIDFRRVDPGPEGRAKEGLPEPLHHVGTYAYRPERIMTFVRHLEPTAREKAESLEQLRALENGWKIRVLRASRPAFGVDTREDYDKFIEILKRDYPGEFKPPRKYVFD